MGAVEREFEIEVEMGNGVKAKWWRKEGSRFEVEKGGGGEGP